MSSSSSKKIRKVTVGRLLSPELIEALAELATTEDLPFATLVSLLINEGLDHRQHRGWA